MDPGPQRFSNYSQEKTELSPPASPVQLVEYQPGTVLADGRYCVISTLGHGAMGCVYEVEQMFLKKRFAMKLLLTAFATPSVIKRFQKEAQMVSRLDHPNLVHAVDFGMIDGTQPYLVMDLVIGTTLADYLKQNGPMPLELAIETFIPVCLALDYAHREGVVHRDIKPSNVILERASQGGFVPKIVDFGIAKAELNEETALTQIGEVLGTPLYMSPEQCSGMLIDFRSDIYSLGCVMYESLTGTPPFSGRTSLITMMMHQNDRPLSMKEASMGREFPRALESMVAKLLAKDPHDRYPSCMAIAQDFEYLKRGEVDKIVSAQRAGLKTAKSIPSVKFSTKFLVFVVAILLFGAGALFFFTGRKSAQEETSTSTPDGVTMKHLGADFETYKFAEVGEGSFCPSVDKEQRLLTFPTVDAVGELYWWEKDASQPGKHLALGSFKVPRQAKLIFDIGWDVIAHKASYLAGFTDNMLYGAAVNLRAPWTVWGNDDKLAKTLNILANQSETLRVLMLETIQNSNFAFTDGQFASLNKLDKVQWLCVRRSAVSGDEIAKFKFLPRLEVLALRQVRNLGDLLHKLSVHDRALRRLSLLDCTMSMSDVKALSRLKSLRMLELRSIGGLKASPEASAEMFRNVSQLPELQHLCIDCWNCDLSPQGLANLAKLTRLRSLSISEGPALPAGAPGLIQKVLPGDCKLILLPHQKDFDCQPWCDPLRTNPSEVLAGD